MRKLIQKIEARLRYYGFTDFEFSISRRNDRYRIGIRLNVPANVAAGIDEQIVKLERFVSKNQVESARLDIIEEELDGMLNDGLNLIWPKLYRELQKEEKK